VRFSLVLAKTKPALVAGFSFAFAAVILSERFSASRRIYALFFFETGAPHNFVIPTGAKRSGGTLPWKLLSFL
jgi:hypothetical protein